MKLHKNTLHTFHFDRFVRLNVLLLLMITALTMRPVSCDTTVEEMRMNVIFNINSCDIDSCLRQNAIALSNISNVINKAERDSNITITRIDIRGYASPEGPTRLNTRLAEGRMQAIERVMTDQYRFPDSNLIHSYYSISDLSALIREISLSDIPGRQTALDILTDSITLHDPGMRLRRLKTVQNGRLWNDIKPLLTNLRYVTVIFTLEQRYTVASEIPDTTATFIIDTVDADIAIATDSTVAENRYPDICDTLPAINPSVTQRPRKPLYVSIKTNMLYDALLIPSIGAEVYLGKMTSVNANWSYAWWKSDRHHDYWRYYGGDIAVRRWLGKKATDKPLTGHHIGLYAQILTYDFELGGKGQMGNKYNYGGGLEYGFSLPVSHRLNIDFTLGIGYISGKYHEYIPIDGHYVWQATKRRNWFGPTKAEVSLVWLIGYGNTNKKKGGDR